MTPEMMWSGATLLGSAAVGWVMKVESRLTRHDEIISKLDKLIDILLNDRLNFGESDDHRKERDSIRLDPGPN